MSDETEDKSGFHRRVGGRATANGSGMETMDVSAYEPDDEGGRNIGYCIGIPLSITAWISISDGMLGKETFPWLDRALRSSVDVDWYDLSTGTGGLEGMDGVWESERAADAGSEVVLGPPRLRIYLIAVPNEFAENNEDSEARVLTTLGEEPMGSKFGDELFNGTRLGLDVYPIRATFEDEFEEDEWPRVIEHPIRREPSDGGDLLGGVRLDRDNSRSRSLTNLIVVATGFGSAVTLLRSEDFS